VADWHVDGSEDWSDNQIYSMSTNTANSRLAVGVCGGSIHIYDLRGNEEIEPLMIRENQGDSAQTPLHLAFCNDSSLLAAAFGNGTIRVWNTDTGMQVARHKLDVVFVHNDQIAFHAGVLSWVASAHHACGRMDLRHVLGIGAETT
jgi:WD40 repeat protein